jgi:transcriptional regulator with XRE-family HTH domain
MRLDRMKIMRRDRGLSQSELGARIGVLQPRVATIEGGASVTRETAEKIATALLCDVGDLVAPTEPTITLRLSEIPPELLALLKNN